MTKDLEVTVDHLLSDKPRDKPLPPEIEEFRSLIKDTYNKLYLKYLPQGRDAAEDRAKKETLAYFQFLHAFS